MVHVLEAVHANALTRVGMDLITACDIRFASQDAFFSVKEVDVGLAADIGTLQRLPKIVANHSWVREICFSARNFSASEAAKYGLLGQVFGTKEELMGLCQSIFTMNRGITQTRVTHFDKISHCSVGNQAQSKLFARSFSPRVCFKTNSKPED